MDDPDDIEEQSLHVTQRNSFSKAHSTYPLHLAARNRNLESMKNLLATGANTEKRDKQGRTSLHLVIMSWPRLATTRKESSNVSPFQATLMQICEKVEACLQLLCEHGVDVNAQVDGVNNETALHIAVSCSALSAVQQLVRCGADVNAVDGVGMSPLQRAVGILNKDIIVYLIEQGADVNMGVTTSGNTPLHIVVNVCVTMAAKPQQINLECIIELLKHGADPNKSNNQNRTALQEACSMGSTQMVDLLLNYGGNINKLNKSGENCLFMFLNSGRDVTNNVLLPKLLGLTTPLIFQNKHGQLPSFLQQCSSKLREKILRLSQEPRSLKDTCKAFIYLHHNQNKTVCQQLLPARLYAYVFHEWDDLDKLWQRDAEMTDNIYASSSPT